MNPRLSIALAGIVSLGLSVGATALSRWWPGQPGDYAALVRQKLAPLAGAPAADGKLADEADRAVLRGNALLAAHNPAAAAAEFERAVAQQPAHALGWINLGVAYYQLGRTNDTLRVWTRAYEMDKYNVMVACNLALMLEMQGQLGAARDLYARANRLDPKNPDALRGLDRLKALNR